MVAVFVKIFHKPQPHRSFRSSCDPLRFGCGNSASSAPISFEKLVGALGFGRIHAANGKANVDHHIVAQSGLRDKAERYLAHIPPNCTRAARKGPVPESRGFYRVWPGTWRRSPH